MAYELWHISYGILELAYLRHNSRLRVGKNVLERLKRNGASDIERALPALECIGGPWQTLHHALLAEAAIVV